MVLHKIIKQNNELGKCFLIALGIFIRICLILIFLSNYSEQSPFMTNEYNDVNQSTNTIPNISISKLNALKSAKSYLIFSAFSRQGLIDQLEYEGFTQEDIIYAVDNCDANWFEQAVKSAENYLKYSAFSRQGLIDQLEYEGFTQEEAIYGVNATGL